MCCLYSYACAVLVCMFLCTYGVYGVMYRNVLCLLYKHALTVVYMCVYWVWRPTVRKVLSSLSFWCRFSTCKSTTWCIVTDGDWWVRLSPTPVRHVCMYVCMKCLILSADHSNHFRLFRMYVSRKAATKGMAVLEGVGLSAETINACFSSYPLNEEEAVQAGLARWSGGQGRQPPTWEVLISAMEYAAIAQQHIEDLKKSLGLLGMVCVWMCVRVCMHVWWSMWCGICSTVLITCCLNGVRMSTYCVRWPVGKKVFSPCNIKQLTLSPSVWRYSSSSVALVAG